jgi:hypothetical protein
LWKFRSEIFFAVMCAKWWYYFNLSQMLPNLLSHSSLVPPILPSKGYLFTFGFQPEQFYFFPHKLRRASNFIRFVLLTNTTRTSQRQ